MTGKNVGELAAHAGISVRTLHHYDQIGLLCPTHRRGNGYRSYTAPDEQRLHDILFYRALGFSLGRIAQIMDSPGDNRRQFLLQQQQQLQTHIQRLTAMQSQLQAAIAALPQHLEDCQMQSSTNFDAFDGFDPDQYATETEQRWGNSDAYKESQSRTARYSKADWTRYKNEANALNKRLAQCIQNGDSVSDEAVLHVVEQMRLLIDKWFYPCSRRMHASLGEMYVADERFWQVYEDIQPGMAQFLCDATRASCDRQGSADV